MLKPNGEIGTVCWAEVQTDPEIDEHELHALAMDGTAEGESDPMKVICDYEGSAMNYQALL